MSVLLSIIEHAGKAKTLALEILYNYVKIKELKISQVITIRRKVISLNKLYHEIAYLDK